MKLGIAALAASLLIAGCGGEGSSSTGPGATPPPAAGNEVSLVSQTAGGGERVGPALMRLATADELHLFLGNFENEFANQIRAEVAHVEVDETEVLSGAVAYIGCGSPTSATVVRGVRGLELEPGETDDDTIECVAPVTTVGLVAVPAGELR